jgi:hypothetical protein
MIIVSINLPTSSIRHKIIKTILAVLLSGNKRPISRINPNDNPDIHNTLNGN